uniref:NADH-ubiquinone oxidoreductase chain 6 n=2 Tax=Callorhinchus TaxID=7866 RepID=D7RWR2_CALCY|nr:NADH dehydrogenase subunit 6 [Callorhinchus callorynchus]YP_003734922.1 NADH dehydrogenase subunit 6 [Callorhinchus capensis]ADI57812.1 NADH dehydrogenase subunit 6 [Callorhinchus callorynchus]ADI57825.1 NADH dehydrogenase subunit 6 [Callorhinchus capensis]
MIYFVMLMLMCFIIGLVGVASNPSPYFAAFGLVMSAAIGCGLLASHGTSFLSFVLFLIYLGGMLVVFVYSAALTAEPYPESWLDWPVLVNVMMYLLGVGVGVYYFFGGWNMMHWMGVDELNNFSLWRGDLSGTSLMYSDGIMLLFLAGWVLLLTLFVVLELIRGLGRGALRVV